MNSKSSKRKGLSIIKKVVLILVLALILSGAFEATAGRPILGYVTEAAQSQTYIAQDEAEFVTILREALVNRERNIKIPNRSIGDTQENGPKRENPSRKRI